MVDILLIKMEIFLVSIKAILFILSVNGKGLDIAFGKPAFVTSIDPDNNTVVLGDETDLEKNEMNVAKINWIKYDSFNQSREVITKIRYKDPGSLSMLNANGNSANVVFFEKAKGIAPGQSAVFYEGNDVVAGGIIQRDLLS